MIPPKCPEHEKLQKVKEESQAIGEFLEWLSSTKRYWIAYYKRQDGFIDDYLVPTYKTTEALLAEYFEVDLKIIEQEKREMLKHMRKMNEGEK